jgi:hypothetical protein
MVMNRQKAQQVTGDWQKAGSVYKRNFVLCIKFVLADIFVLVNLLLHQAFKLYTNFL